MKYVYSLSYTKRKCKRNIEKMSKICNPKSVSRLKKNKRWLKIRLRRENTSK